MRVPQDDLLCALYPSLRLKNGYARDDAESGVRVSEVKNKVKGSGQECSLHTIQLIHNHP